MRQQPSKRARRTFLVAAAATVAVPTPVSSQQPMTWRFQSTWPAGEFHDYALDFARVVNEVTAGKLKIEMLPAGAVVPAFNVLDAVHRGTIDGSHNVCAYWVGKNPAYGLFGAGPSFGMDAHMLLGWMEYGGGKELYEELHRRIMKFNVEGFLYGPFPTQPLGWFRKEVKSPTDLAGLRYRSSGLAVDMFKAMGAEVVSLPAGQILQGIRDKVIDAAEFATTTSDRQLGLPSVLPVCMVQSYHQPLECFEVLVNADRFASLPPDVQVQVRAGVRAASADLWLNVMHRNSMDYQAMQTKDKVRMVRTPREVLRAQLQAWDRVTAAKSIENRFFAKVVESQKRWASRVVPWYQEITVSGDMAQEHYFQAPAKK